MTLIDAAVVVSATPAEVWRALLAHERWPEWCAGADGAVRLSAVTPLTGTAEQVGATRRCTATLAPLAWTGPRQVTWTECVTDIWYPWTVEFEARERALALRRWRLRLTLVPEADGQTRVYARLCYAPRDPALWLVDACFLRRTLAQTLVGALLNLARSLEASSSLPMAAPSFLTPPPTAAAA
jgi:hypothetical protein